MIDFFFVAGEPSGDLHGSHLIRELQVLAPHLNLKGVAGERMRALGISSSVNMEKLMVMGFLDVAAALPRLYQLFRRIRTEILKLNPKAVVCIDYPGFNLRLERSLRKKGYRGKLIHYISPTVWAWGKRRIPLMAKHLDLLLTLFPFEPACFKHTSLSTIHVGHPLVKKTFEHKESQEFFQRYSLDPQQKILALFPGSRKKELEQNLALQLKTAQRLKQEIPDLRIVISKASHDLPIDSPYPLIEPEHTYDLMQKAHLALAVSGTVTLELALFETPTIVQYAIKPFDVFLAQNIFKIKLPHYCIVNIIAQERVFPELFGPELTLERLVHHAKQLWHCLRTREECQKGCKKVRISLGKEDSSHKACLELLRQITY